MLTTLIGKLFKLKPRRWTEDEIRELIHLGSFEHALTATDAMHPATPNKELKRLCLRAEIAFRTHRDDDAKGLYGQVLKRAPGFADAHYGLSLLHLEQDRIDVACQHAIFAKNMAPAEPRYLAQLGLCHIRMGNYPMAEEPLRQAVRLNPNDKSAWNNLGIAQLAKGKINEARASFGTALRLDPHFQKAQDNLTQLTQDEQESATQTRALHNHRSAPPTHDEVEVKSSESNPPWHSDWQHVQAMLDQGHMSQGIAAAERLISLWPDDAEMVIRMNDLYRRVGEPESGLALLESFSRKNQGCAKIYLCFGLSYLEDSLYAKAEHFLRKAEEISGGSELILRQLGLSLTKQERHTEADHYYAMYWEKYPSEASAALRASSYIQTCQYEKALEILDQLDSTGSIQDQRMELVYASALAYSGRLNDALEILNRLAATQPNSPTMRSTRAQIHLQLEQFDQGWDDYRYRNFSYSRFFRVLPVSEWHGEPLEGKTIVVLAEQGLGDQVMFASCLPDLLALNPKRVVVEAVDRVAPTLARSFPKCEVIATRQDKQLEWLRDIDGVDYFIPMGELPRHFRRSINQFPRHAYIVPDPERVRHWRAQLQSLGPGPYLGTSWRGGSEQTRKAIRTLSPALLRPLVNALPAQWVCLQYGTRPQLQNELTEAAQARVQLAHWPEAIADLDEFAALVAALDGVVTVCNTTVHYAGAVGQKTWVLAPTVPEWRYGLHNSHMPWYPHVEVLRQTTANDWSTVIHQACDRLIDNYCA